MKYFSSNDYDLCYNKSSLNNAINSAEKIITDICKNVNNLECYISEMENNAHDKCGTRVDEDYRDYQQLLGPNSLVGLLEDISKDLDELKQNMSQYERKVNENQERRRREEERRAAEAKRLQSFKF